MAGPPERLQIFAAAWRRRSGLQRPDVADCRHPEMENAQTAPVAVEVVELAAEGIGLSKAR